MQYTHPKGYYLGLMPPCGSRVADNHFISHGLHVILLFLFSVSLLFFFFYYISFFAFVASLTFYVFPVSFTMPMMPNNLLYWRRKSPSPSMLFRRYIMLFHPVLWPKTSHTPNTHKIEWLVIGVWWFVSYQRNTNNKPPTPNSPRSAVRHSHHLCVPHLL